MTGKVRGIALKAAGAVLHAELRAAANTERRTANAAMRDMDCIMTTTSYCVAEQVSNGLGVVVGGNDEGHKWSTAACRRQQCLSPHTRAVVQPLQLLCTTYDSQKALKIRME